MKNLNNVWIPARFLPFHPLTCWHTITAVRVLHLRHRYLSWKFYDMLYTDLSKNPIEVINKMYAHFGLTLTDKAEQNMKEFLNNNPKHKHGEHRYSLSHYGLSEAAISSCFKNYIQRYQLGVSWPFFTIHNLICLNHKIYHGQITKNKT